MSTEPNVQRKERKKNYKKAKDVKDGTEQREKNEKRKRKRDADPDLEAGEAPTKKRRSSEQPNSTRGSSDPSLLSNSADHSPFHTQTSSLLLPLSPISQLYPLQGICAEHLSPLILTYHRPFRGVVLSYSNPQLSENPRDIIPGAQQEPVLARSVNEYAASFVWVTADFLIFKPQKGGWTEGWVNLQNEGHLGLVCWNLFNASIERKRLPTSWRWVEGGLEVGSKEKSKQARNLSEPEASGGEKGQKEPQTTNDGQDTQGYFEDENGNKVEGRLGFRIRDVDTSLTSDREKSFLTIEGTLLSDREEEALQEQEAIRSKSHNLRESPERRGGAVQLRSTLTGGHTDSSTKTKHADRPKSKAAK
ncbi:MAG: hypothetical protein Q9187_001805 [Circinaria calcarea]